MCGIHVSISMCAFCKPNDILVNLLRNRGPDSIGYKEAQFETNNGSRYYMSFTSTVLALRGKNVSFQPFKDNINGSVFCWNGEAWKLGPERVMENDGKVIFDLLMRASSNTQNNFEATNSILEVLSKISGPFAFVFFDQAHKQLYFGRDRLGRRSLLYKQNLQNSLLELCSVSDPAHGPWFEVEANGICQLSLTDNLPSVPFSRLQNHKWLTKSLNPCVNPVSSTQDKNLTNLAILEPHLGNFNTTIPLEPYTKGPETKSVESLHYWLHRSLELRISQVTPSTSISKENIQSSCFAILFSGGLDCTVLARIAHDILPLNQAIDLLNVAFENPRAVQAIKNAKAVIQGHKLNDLSEDFPYEICPDRETGRRSFKELLEVCPERTWRFVAINVPYSETLEHRQNLIHLIHPHQTEMDLSIAYALYFASRGIGLAYIDPSATPESYKTPARILLSGLGADELFGGYTRHSTAFKRSGFPGLLHELNLDIKRLEKRNLGRDDRVISRWGKEAMYPFLDEALVRWAIETPISEKCGFGIGKNHPGDPVWNIEPGKLILRLLSLKMGMVSAAMEKKRAVL